MAMTWRIAGCIVLLTILQPPAAAQTTSDNIQHAERIEHLLADHGFENVAVASTEGQLTVTYEDRLYRYDVRGLAEAARLVMAELPADVQLTLIPQRRGVPLTAVAFPPAANVDGNGELTGQDRLEASMDVSADIEGPWNLLEGRERRNASFLRVDLVLRPQFSALFGDRQDAFRTQVGIAPELSTSLWKGMRLSTQWIIPLQNDLGGDGDHVRPGVTAINQVFRLPERSFLSISAGYFTLNQYGMDVEAAAYLDEGRWLVSARSGYTGEAFFEGGTWTYSAPSVWTFGARVEYFVPAYTASLHASVNRFVYGDVGVHFGVDREFGEVTLGLFGLQTTDDSNVGVRVVAPLFLRKHSRPRRLRVRSASAFPWEYRYQGLPQAGMQFQTRTTHDAPWEELEPQYIQNQLHRLNRERH